MLFVIRTNSDSEQGAERDEVHKEHQDHHYAAATSILQNLLVQQFQSDRADKMINTAAPRELYYHHGETIATVHTDLYGNVTRCNLFEIK